MAAKFINNRGISFYTADQVKKIREKCKMNQTEFWAAIGVSQSGGSRYESGRSIPESVQILIKIIYGPVVTGDNLIKTLRNQIIAKKVAK